MRFFSTMIPFFLTASGPERLTELKSSITPILPKILERYERGVGLDVNCWTGESTHHLQEKFPHLQFHGIDKNGTAIELARHRFRYPKFSVSDLEKNRFEGQKDQNLFQLIQISNYENLEKILWNTYPLLHHDGFIILHYKAKDRQYMEELYKKNLKFPRRQKNGIMLENMYLDKDVAIILK